MYRGLLVLYQQQNGDADALSASVFQQNTGKVLQKSHARVVQMKEEVD